MLESLLIPDDVDTVVWTIVTVAVVLLGAARVHSADRWWCPNLAWFWWPLRRAALPTLDRLLDSVSWIPAKTRVYENEIVAEGLDVTLEELHDDLAEAGYEAQPLASIATLETSGEFERSSTARYTGPRTLGWLVPDDVLEALPDWFTRKQQVHLRPFGEGGDLTVTAHLEKNAWNPTTAVQHLLAIGFDAEAGVAKAADDLGLEQDPED